MFEQMRRGNTGPNGGVFLTMRHLDAEVVRRQFKGMVERCLDVGFDLVSGLVEVTPTAHYMMGGLEFEPDCQTTLRGLFAAGEDTGGVHGANRLGGNGVANSTVFGGIAGQRIAGWVKHEGALAPPDTAAIDSAVARCLSPFARPAGDPAGIRERLYSIMWDDVGIMRNRSGLEKARAALEELAVEIEHTGIGPATREFNLGWHDWLNLDSQILISRAITLAALNRGDSRGAHFREEHPHSGPLDHSAYTRVHLQDGRLAASTKAVAFTRVRPGASLLN